MVVFIWQFLTLIPWTVLFVSAANPTPDNCTQLIQTLKLHDHVKLILTQPYPDNSTFRDPYSLAYNGPAPNLPAFCRAYANMSTSASSATLFEVWLPLNTWNRRYLTVGNGGGAGGVNYPALGQGLRAGFAVASTDAGHNSSAIAGSWQGLGDEVAIDFGWRSVHLTTVYAKAITTVFYGRRYTHSYYTGCSSGGKQGLKSVQRFPEDFDGALVGAPAWNWNYLNAWSIHVNTYQSDSSTPGYIPPDKMQFLAGQVVQACDALDGVQDGVISNPRNCHFRPESLLCKYFPPNTTRCFTPPQVVNLGNIYRDYVETNNTYIFPAFEKGSEGMWTFTVTGKTWQLQPLYYSEQVLNVTPSSYDAYSLNYSTIALAQKINPGDVIANNFNMTPYFNRNGKILHYHGWADGLISSRSSIDFYTAVERTIPTNFSNNYRLFMVPGMMHCSSGPGPWVFNTDPNGFALDPKAGLVKQLMDWVEKDIAPDTLLGTKYFNDTGPGIVFQRPICQYPMTAVWSGQ